jgi:tRNA(fMet)-specific endonuclease VapC
VIRYLLDTDCSIYAMLGTFPALGHRLSECEVDEVAISAISLAEIFMGEGRGKPPDMPVIDAFLRVVPLLPFEESAARAYANLPFRRRSFDRLIAAHAISLGATIVTNNEADFADVAGLKVENWTA